MRGVERVRVASEHRWGRTAVAAVALLAGLLASPGFIFGPPIPSSVVRIASLELSWEVAGGLGSPDAAADDTTPPTVTITGPAAGSVFHVLVITLTGTASDDVAIEEVLVSNELSLDPSAWGEAHGKISWSGEVRLLREGTNTVHARAVDTSGNMANATLTVVLGLEPYRIPAGAVMAASFAAIAAGVALIRRMGRRGPQSPGS